MVKYLVVCLVFCLPAMAGNCSVYNRNLGPFNYGLVGNYHHINGAHQWAESQSGSCKYTGTAGNCSITAAANSLTPGQSDTGALSVMSVHHSGGVSTKQGLATGSGTTVMARTVGAVAFQECFISCGTAPTITGVGPFNVTFPSGTIFSDEREYDNGCPPHTAPREGTSTTTCGKDSGTTCSMGSPILIDTMGMGYHLSDPDVSFVTFDLKNDGHPERWSWPIVGSGNGWLVLDHDRDHQIDDGADLFGNWTPLPGQSSPPENKDWNGFLALAAYDDPENGGNLDGMISKEDRVWPRLKVWVDVHCALEPTRVCKARRSELHSLNAMGITSLSLVYTLVDKQDKYGNTFKYEAKVNPVSKKHLQLSNRNPMYDVYLVTQGNTDRGKHDNEMQ